MDRVYVILNIMEGKRSEAVQSLRANPGVRWVDVLEGQWDVITAIEASNRSRLAKLVVRAISSVETITEDIQLLPTYDGSSMESKTDRVGTVATYKAKNSKQARHGRDESNVPSSV
jgi:uncharacterized protein with GYD domain